SRLCATLRDMDPEGKIFSYGAISLTRNQAAICAHSTSSLGGFVGAQSRNGIIKDFYSVDTPTLEYKQPLTPIGMFPYPLSVENFTIIRRYDTVVNIWNESLASGEVMDLSQYWVDMPYPPMYAAFVFPFFEVYDDNSTGVGYLFETVYTANVTSMEWYNASETGIRVMLLGTKFLEEGLLVYANNWGQPLSNVSDVWMSTWQNEPMRFMYVDDVT
ncbi:protein kinase, partial [Trypanosoma grayi]|uniref:protein kinase n=1 Tax=Trypanosoma grayi TaxID=71804 RepID=UPI0004F47B85